MITFSNGHRFDYMIASGALAFDGKGWPWERPLVTLGLIKPELFTMVLKTLTTSPRAGNLRMWKPWGCVRSIPGGAVNKVGLTNPGFSWWYENIAPYIDYRKYSVVGSIFGDTLGLQLMAELSDKLDLVALEVNPSCPNTGHGMPETDEIIESVKAVKEKTEHPIIIKVSVAQDYLAIARGLEGVAEAISINSVPWHMVFGQKRSPLWRLEKKVGGGGGGVSGKPAQERNWQAVRRLATQGSLPVIGPSVMEYEDMDELRYLGASAVSFGAIHVLSIWKPWTLFTNPCKPTQFVRKERNERGR